MPVIITDRVTDEAIITVDNINDLREVVIRLVRRGVSLSDANLRDAALSGANLNGADLRDADLRGAALCDADLRHADLGDANLRDADLRGADLSGANLSGTNLNGADLRDANLQPVKDDLYAVLSYAPAEVPALIEALENGNVNGSTYCDGECGCLVGTLAIAAGAEKISSACSSVHGLRGNGRRPIERLFLAINKGDTPDNSQFAKLAHEWATKWLERMQAAFK